MGLNDKISQGDLRNMRAKYNDNCNVFTEGDLESNEPFLQFKKWLDDAIKTPGILEANAMCLATANRNGTPSARYVLLKGYGTNGFDFYTNYNSRKGKDMEENPQAALTFYWEPLKRSVRIEGRVEKINEKESEEYFHSRPRDSQISASVSKQSKVVDSRETMVKEIQNVLEKIGTGDVPKPQHWGGYRLVPDSIEFWQGQSNRLHDRIKFRKLKGDDVIDNSVTHMGQNGWVYERLYP
ncbi:pyridoxine/pyridoxamine 5'-phosphate oxidase-like isoform X2 [Lycorma delicatula]|uniref:pyridoxine/pyridoxamine 5'-phosphate oxidase-like isoform X2 n=1 Tax=Lycorma delicatula TaxID=130591 RepID=UPI003F50DCF6